MPDRLLHDAAFRIARQSLDALRHLLRPEGTTDAFAQFCTIATEGVQEYAETEERRRKRLRPEGN